MTVLSLKQLVQAKDPGFWSALEREVEAASRLDQILPLASLARHARSIPRENATPLRLAIIGGSTLHPLSDVVELLLTTAGFSVDLFVGGYDDAEPLIRDTSSALHAFRPALTVFLPAERRCIYPGLLTDSGETARELAAEHATQLLGLCAALNAATGSEVALANYPLPGRRDPGAYRSRTLTSEWSFRKLVNLELGVRAPAFVHIVDAEYLSARRGLVASRDDRAWFESKQAFAVEMQLDVAKEIAHIVASLRRPAAKVLVMDLDNTLWGGVIGDDGLERIEIGDTSPRGEAFKAFQRHALELSRRGVLLAVCSKNEHATAAEPFEKHPEMVLRLEHFASFQANWNPKSDNLRAIAEELNLGTDSLVFVDDNPAEIEIVRRFAPEVRTILLGPDPADYVAQLQDSQFFEPRLVTSEDLKRSEQYRQERQRNALRESMTDMDAFLASLDMRGTIRPFNPIDTPRITQLINKSNQFNLTTIRRTEHEVLTLCANGEKNPAFVVRLSDRFGDHGLIAAVICEIDDTTDDRTLVIDTWVMSCRVLKRQVEEEIINEIFRIAAERGCDRVVGRYIPTAKNGLVRALYSDLGFDACREDAAATIYARDVATFKPFQTRIAIELQPK